MTSTPSPLPVRPALAPLLRLASFLRPYRLRIAAAIVALIIAAGGMLAVGQGLKVVIDSGFASGDPKMLNTALGGMFVIAVVLAASTYARFYLMMTTGERIVTDLRKKVFDHVLTLSPAYFDSARTGEIISRVTNDTAQLQMVVGYGVSMFVRNLLMMVGAMVLLFITSPKLAALVLLGVPATMIPIMLLGRRLRRLARESQDRVADVSAHIDETIHEIRTVQAYAHEHIDRARFADRAESALQAARRSIGQRAVLIALVMLIAFCAVGLILWVGGNDVFANRITVGELSAFVFYALIVAGSAGNVSEMWGELQRAGGATERLMELLDTKPQIAAPATPAVLPDRFRGEVRFEQVRFAYPSRPDNAALAGLTLHIAPGERVALVGPSGAGKSTVIALLMRFYDPQAGKVLIDGIDITTCDPLELRRRIGLVSQDPVIFAATARENVRYGCPDAADAQIRAALQAAHAMEFVERLPQGLDSELGERGVQLSGGQRQRLSIARALLADRPILLLDEATSALDAASERLVQEALETLMRGRTSLVIAHRFSTVRDADRIVVMEHGHVHAIGRHEDLMRQDGLYAHLAQLQFLDVGVQPAADAAPPASHAMKAIR